MSVNTAIAVDSKKHNLLIHPRVRPVPFDKNTLFFLEEDGYCVLEDPDAVAFVHALLQGPRPLSDMEAAASFRSPEHSSQILCQLKQAGFVVSVPVHWTTQTLAFWADSGLPLEDVLWALSYAPVHIQRMGVSGLDLERNLAILGFQISSKAGLRIVFVDDFLNPALATVDAHAHANDAPWILVKPYGSSVWFTTFIPGTSPCWHCLARRIQFNRRGHAFLASKGRIKNIPYPSCSDLFSTHRFAQRIGLEIVRLRLQTPELSSSGSVVRMTPSGGEHAHPVLPRPACSRCGTPQDSLPASLHLQPRTKIQNLENGSRSVPVGDAFQKYADLIDPLTGVFWNLQRLRTPDGLHAYSIQHTLSNRIDTLNKLRANEHCVSGGKGRTALQAKTSALFEAIERFSGVWRPDLQTKTATYHDLTGQAFHPHDLLLFSEWQYQHRAAWNAACDNPMLWQPAPFDPHEPIDWTPTQCLSDHRTYYLPTRYTYYDYPTDVGTAFCEANSNGCAAGYYKEDAILQGLLELIERDALAIWWYNRVLRPGVDLDVVQDAYIHQVRSHYETLGRMLWVLDVTSDIGIPVFCAVSKQTQGSPKWLLGFGCHLDPQIALSRAVIELNQLLPAFQSVAPPLGAPNWLYSADAHPYLLPDPNTSPIALSTYPVHTRNDIRDEIGVCKTLLGNKGLHAYVIDQTHPDIGAPVVRVVVPGLLHYWRRLGGRRLYDVPVARGWLTQSKTETEMNPLDLTL